MQGKKNYQEELFTSFQLSDRIPEHNSYRRLKGILDLEYLYLVTEKFYGDSGLKSIDPVVFFKICLAGYLENITTDRGLMNHCSMRLDILYFFRYDVDEELTLAQYYSLQPEKYLKFTRKKVKSGAEQLALFLHLQKL